MYRSCCQSTLLKYAEWSRDQVVQSLLTRIIDRNREFSIPLLGHDFPQSICSHLILNRAITHYGCGARELSGL